MHEFPNPDVKELFEWLSNKSGRKQEVSEKVTKIINAEDTKKETNNNPNYLLD